MNTEKAIKVINATNDWFEKYFTREDYLEGLIPKETLRMLCDIPKVVDLLKCGEKFEKIVDKMKSFTSTMCCDNCNNKIFKLEQKYFLKEK